MSPLTPAGICVAPLFFRVGFAIDLVESSTKR
jgi:hypothetical protein